MNAFSPAVVLSSETFDEPHQQHQEEGAITIKNSPAGGTHHDEQQQKQQKGGMMKIMEKSSESYYDETYNDENQQRGAIDVPDSSDDIDAKKGVLPFLGRTPRHKKNTNSKRRLPIPQPSAATIDRLRRRRFFMNDDTNTHHRMLEDGTAILNEEINTDRGNKSQGIYIHPSSAFIWQQADQTILQNNEGLIFLQADNSINPIVGGNVPPHAIDLRGCGSNSSRIPGGMITDTAGACEKHIHSNTHGVQRPALLTPQQPISLPAPFHHRSAIAANQKGSSCQTSRRSHSIFDFNISLVHNCW